ncbi:hypothetical protein [Streptomyces tropicalis]|uniref:Transposase n=1 Tax=Streptomyces tropicalis TaxID=3034234 RepID=A0ABT6A4K3_9ACTN|nr:hypothetical protein [Streptomyces tropicalis]MDF3299580.1 hypothetical protein [Streptomyces tropicalis]
MTVKLLVDLHRRKITTWREDDHRREQPIRMRKAAGPLVAAVLDEMAAPHLEHLLLDVTRPALRPLPTQALVHGDATHPALASAARQPGLAVSGAPVAPVRAAIAGVTAFTKPCRVFDRTDVCGIDCWGRSNPFRHAP